MSRSDFFTCVKVYRLIIEEQLKSYTYCTTAKHNSYRSEIQLAKVNVATVKEVRLAKLNM